MCTAQAKQRLLGLEQGECREQGEGRVQAGYEGVRDQKGGAESVESCVALQGLGTPGSGRRDMGCVF